jgi:hypothetical protein
MMTDEIKIKMTGESSGLTAEFNKLHKATAALVTDLTETSKAAKKYGESHGAALAESTAQMNKLHAAAERWKRQVESPATSHAKNLKELGALYRMGKLSLDEYTASVKTSEQAMSAATSKGSSGLNDMLSKIGGAAAGFVGIGSAIGGMAAAAAIIKREYENLLQTQKSAADKQMDVATAQREALANLAPDAGMSDAEFVSWVEKTAKETGADPKSVYQSAGAVLSMKGDLPVRQALETVEVSAAMNPHDVEAIKQNAAAQTNLMVRDPSFRAKDVAGQFLAAKMASPTISDKSFSQHIATGAAQGMSFGESAREAFALRATIGVGAGDAEGAVTASAAINFAKQLKELMPTVQGGTVGRIQALQTPEFAEVRSKLLGAFDDQKQSTEKSGLLGEARAFSTLIELVQGRGTRATQLLESNLTSIPDTEGSAKYVDQLQQRMFRQPLQQSADLQRRLKGGAAALQLGNIGGGRQSITREGLQELLQNAGYDTATQGIALAEFEANTLVGGADPVAALGKQLQRKAGARLATTQLRDSAADIYGGGAVEVVPRTPSAEDQRIGGELGRLADVLIQFTADQNRLMEEQNRMLRDGRNPVSVPGAKPSVAPPGRPASADRAANTPSSMRP